LRARSTASEQILWERLRGGRFHGLKFRRQHPIDRFVLDFYCPEIRLAVEVDGEVHASLQEADTQRQTILEAMGIRFVRLDARLVEHDIAPALAAIEREALAHPSPQSRERGRPQGGGEG
jgi:very-short-patch-repair endonuclease